MNPHSFTDNTDDRVYFDIEDGYGDGELGNGGGDGESDLDIYGDGRHYGTGDGSGWGDGIPYGDSDGSGSCDIERDRHWSCNDIDLWILWDSEQELR